MFVSASEMCFLETTKISFFSKMENRRAEQVLSGGGCCQWEGEGCGERVQKGEYGAKTVTTCIKMEK
jgi:hypothetical protein